MTSAPVPARHRAARLAALLGDPLDPDNPVGHRAVLRADERAELLTAGEQLLDGYGLNAEFVPAEHGGRLTRLDELIDILRVVYRRDPALGLGYGVSSLISAVNVWTAADAEQRARVAGILLGNGRIAAAYHELAHGNDIAGTELAATPDGQGRWRLNGRKEVVTNIQRADALMVLTRTTAGAGQRNHAQFLVEKRDLPAGALRYLPRYATVGLRGVRLGGAEFHDCPVTEADLLGRPGHGLETAMRSFQITRTVLPSIMTGILDSALRAALRHTTGRRLHGAPVAELPHIRSLLVGAFVDLLTCEALSTVVARTTHLAPRQSSVYGAVVKYAVSTHLLRALDDLATVLGAESFVRDGAEAIFQKLHRDIKPVGFGHAARAACQTALLPHLGLLHRQLAKSSELPATAFQSHGELPPLPFGQLAVASRGQDPIAHALPRLAAELTPADAPLVEHAGHLRAELDQLVRAGAALPPDQLSLLAEPATYALTARYVAAVTGTACLGRWLCARGEPAADGSPDWLVAALTRLRATGRGRAPRALPAALERRLFAELTRRVAEGRDLGLPGPHSTDAP
ncbi:acyl-CoA dehydrogenase [Streptomyces sp. DSM 44915]|uniref:Acyl-CoA dehydrogenase n=1 Tax=Streptomyces chisholmiae TaxID=3075540 RepID=A0ABU2JWM3_9ACTN|nr:acyl-CoA dehydrogenase [Streptomyces sp. DSM 44915]MDT0269139.1 acyl-CoA dehydrogenase [Streptomyces sp. DSM 44915]